MPIQSAHTQIMVIITIALPISLAFFDKGCISGPILSIMVSIAVLIISAIIMNTKENNIIMRDNPDTSRKHNNTVAKTHKNMSWRNADSDLYVAIMPSIECINA